MNELIRKGNLYVHPSGAFRIRERKGRAYEYELSSMPGVWKSTGMKTLDEAVAMLYKTPKGQLISGRINGMTFGEFAKDFYRREDENSQKKRDELFGKRMQDRSYRAKQSYLDAQIMPRFGNVLLADIKAEDIEEWYICLTSRNGRQLASATKYKVLDALSEIMADAKRKKLIQANPCAEVEKIAVRTENPRAIFSDIEIRSFFPRSIEKTIEIWGNAKNALFFSIMVDTGFRPCEIAALRVDSFCNGGVYADEDVNAVTGKLQKRIKTSDKGVKAKAALVSDYTMRLLDAHIKSGEVRDGYLFKAENGKFPLVSTQTNKKAIEKAAVKAGVIIDDRTAYSFRHAFCTRMMASLGEDDLKETDVRMMMGHTGYRPEYDHRTPEQLINRLKKVSGIVEALHDK